MNKTDENMVSLYEYLGRASGGQLGKRVAAFAAQQKTPVNMGKRYVSNPKYKGDVLTYPKEFLDSYFKTPPQAHVDEINTELNEAQFDNYDDLPFLKIIMTRFETVIVVWQDGSYKFVNSNESWEYENDKDWLTTIELKQPAI